jgi:hypothetical protein
MLCRLYISRKVGEYKNNVMSYLDAAPAKSAESKPSEGDSEILDAIVQAKKATSNGTEFSYEEKDVILYSEF